MEDIKSTIDRCCLCNISNLDYNIKNIEKGYGKLYGWRGSDLNPKFFFVGMNPSHNRFSNLEYAFGGLTDNEGTGRKFVDILENIGIINESYVTNLVKCSSQDNSVNEEFTGNCYSILKEEIKMVKPKIIIAMGNDVHNFLITKKLDIPLYKIFHPNYIISYQPGKIEEYKNNIRRICS